MTHAPPKWIVAITGGSGIPYAIRLLDQLELLGIAVDLIISEAGLRVITEETELKLGKRIASVDALIGRKTNHIVLHSHKDIGALPASGSCLYDGMVIVPCSMATLGNIANGSGYNLVHRAADVTIKEGRKLVLVPRETPLSSIHLRNMLTLSNIGVKMVPAMPGFYSQPKQITDLVDGMVMKILDCMGIKNSIATRWGEAPNEQGLKIIGSAANYSIVNLK